MSALTCKICNQSIINCRYIQNEWGEVIHVGHDGVEQCHVCGRFISSDYLKTAVDKVCDVCIKSIVRNKLEIDWVKSRVIPVLNKNGVDFDFNSIPIEIVPRDVICKHNGMSEINYNIRGLTKIKKSISLISQSLSYDIYMLQNLPKVAFAGVLAHEYMHVWLSEQNIQMSQDKIEGFCNMGSFLALSTISHELSGYLIKCMKESPDPIYGDGFRFMYNHYEKKGWINLLNKVKTMK